MLDIICEILLIGNELLIGKIQDTNGKWLIDQLVPHGVKISRITVIQDDLNEISQTVREILNRKPNYVFTSGGLGPTFDDMTIEGIAIGLGIQDSIDFNEQSLQWLKERYEYVIRTQMVKTKPGTTAEDLLNASRKKMAKMPKQCIPIRNSVGAAPGVKFPKHLTNNFTEIYALPGVPSELKAIFSEYILPEIVNQIKGHKFTQARLIFEDVGESNLSGYITKIKDRYPEIWIKTHPHFAKNEETDKNTYFVELHLTSFNTQDGIIQKMEELLNNIENRVVSLGGRIISKEKTTQQE